MKRYVLETDKYIIDEHYGVKTDSEAYLEPNFNVIPGNTMPIIIQEGESRTLITSAWGLRTEGNDENQVLPSISQEELLEKDEHLKLVNSNPCIIPASGFYKWKETVDDPLPFYIRFLTDDVFSIPGFFTTWKNSEGRTIHTFAAITMDANPLVQPLDDSMPCILDHKHYDLWLSGQGAELLEKGFKGDHLLVNMAVVRVPELVNDPSNNAKELIQPIPKLRNYDGAEDD